MVEFNSAQIGSKELSISVDAMIFDSGSSVNHIPTKDYELLINAIYNDHNCRTIFNPNPSIYCDCSGADDETFPTISLHSSSFVLNFHPRDYLIYELVALNQPKQCLVTFMEEERFSTSFWLLGDSFLRAFYTIYDATNKRIGVVGDIITKEIVESTEEASISNTIDLNF